MNPIIQDITNTFSGAFGTAFIFAMYFLPTLWAYYAKHQHAPAIAILNIFLGWTCLGWVIALVWAGMKSKE